MRRKLREARHKHGYKGVPLGHVRAHTGEHGNEYVDNLATTGMHAGEPHEAGLRTMYILPSTNAPT